MWMITLTAKFPVTCSNVYFGLAKKLCGKNEILYGGLLKGVFDFLMGK